MLIFLFELLNGLKSELFGVHLLEHYAHHSFLEKTFRLRAKVYLFNFIKQLLGQYLVEEGMVEVPLVNIRGTTPNEKNSLSILLAVSVRD
jgi:hypothetical protein